MGYDALIGHTPPHRLGRPLSNAEHAVLADRLDRLGEDRLVDLFLTHDGDALAAWLADPTPR